MFSVCLYAYSHERRQSNLHESRNVGPDDVIPAQLSYSVLRLEGAALSILGKMNPKESSLVVVNRQTGPLFSLK